MARCDEMSRRDGMPRVSPRNLTTLAVDWAVGIRTDFATSVCRLTVGPNWPVKAARRLMVAVTTLQLSFYCPLGSGDIYQSGGSYKNTTKITSHFK